MFHFDKYLARWHLTPDGDPIITHSSHLIPVRYEGCPAMLKIARVDEEQRGAHLMIWWNGVGAARVIHHDDDALLLERATGHASLMQMVQSGLDDQASRIICDVADQLHRPKQKPPSNLVTLSQWFSELEGAAKQHGGILKQALSIANSLLTKPQEITVLHGDIHHGNILDFAARGWLAIDPKGLIGERGFDYANIFCNPDIEVATKPGRLSHQVNVVADAAKLDHKRLLEWILAYAGLSAAWTLGENGKPDLALSIAELAAAELTK